MWTACVVIALISSSWASAAWAAPPPPLAHEAELLWQQVGWMSDQLHPCPTVAVGWDLPIQLDLMGERFCLYRFVGGPVTPQDILLLSGLPDLDDLEPDHLAVAPMSSLDEILKEEQSATFLEQLGDTFLPPTSYAHSVRLGILDTQPTNEWIDLLGTETSEHGKSLRRWSHHVLCPSGGCLVQSHSRLALAYRSYHATDFDLVIRDEEHGGLVGTIAELGQAIYDDVIGAGMGGPALGPHVINLSVAWDGNVFGGLERRNSGVIDVGAMPLDVRLVFRALQHAADAGVLVIAAAGNQADHLQPGGPLLPAAWEQVPADGYGSPTGPYRPLLYAVGGVDAAGGELSNAQPASRPPLVAFGDHGTLSTASPDVETATLTGSSVATLVVSAAAAAAWSYAQDFSAGQLMDEIYNSGNPLPGAAVEFCLPDPESLPCSAHRPMARRISVCRAVKRVCAIMGTCSEPFGPGSPTPCAPWTGAPINYTDALLSTFVPQGVTSISSWGPNLPAPEDCVVEPERDMSYGPASESACPSWQFNGQAATPWVDPQPGSTPCPNCPLVRGQLTIDLADNVVGIAKNPTLVLCNDEVLNLPVPDLDADLVSSHRVEGIVVSDECDAGLLSFVIEDDDGNETSTLSPVQIVH